MRLRSLFRPVYLVRRVAYWVYVQRHPHEPWLAQGAVRFLDQNLKPGHSGFEWGSGRSTAWFARRLKQLTSIEHDPAWHAEVSRQLAAAGTTNVTYLQLPLEHPEADTYQNDYPELPAYVRAMDAVPAESLDFVLVDGWYRPVCARAALPKLKPGGLLGIDNTDWQDPPHFHVPKDWPLVHRSRNVMTETSIWRKPS